MAGDILDIANGIIQKFAAVLNINVELAFKDERSEAAVFPTAVLQLVDPEVDIRRRVGGLTKYATGDPESGVVMLRPMPIPVTLHWQLDLVTERFDQFFSLTNKIAAVLGAQYTKIITPAGESIHLMRESSTPIPPFGDSLLQVSYRFNVQTWFDSVEAAVQAFTILGFEVNLNKETLAVGDIEP